jgi:glutamate 5-kinase
VVRIIGPEGEIARGLSRLSSAQAARISGLSRDAGRSDDAGEPFPVLIHKDDLVVLAPS